MKRWEIMSAFVALLAIAVSLTRCQPRHNDTLLFDCTDARAEVEYLRRCFDTVDCKFDEHDLGLYEEDERFLERECVHK